MNKREAGSPWAGIRAGLEHVDAADAGVLPRRCSSAFPSDARVL